MEEDIKILERRVKDLKLMYAITNPEIKAIENLLKRYKELEEEVESQDKTIDKLVEEQEEREKYVHSLEEENKELKKGRIRQLERYTEYHNKQIDNFNKALDDFIPISVIQNKKSKLIEEDNTGGRFYSTTDVIVLIDELLEESK
jgi:uncharacterized phage infection (PIP) family protein YhgE